MSSIATSTMNPASRSCSAVVSIPRRRAERSRERPSKPSRAPCPQTSTNHVPVGGPFNNRVSGSVHSVNFRARPAVLGVEGFDRVRGANHFPVLGCGREQDPVPVAGGDDPRRGRETGLPSHGCHPTSVPWSKEARSGEPRSRAPACPASRHPRAASMKACRVERATFI